MGLSAAAVRSLLLAAPEILAEKDFELQRKWEFIKVQSITESAIAFADNLGFRI